MVRQPDEAKRVLDLLRAAQASVQLVDRYLNSHGYWHQCGSAKRLRGPDEGEESGERVVEAVMLVRATKASLQLVERYLDSVPVCRHTLVTRRLPTGLRDNAEFVTECARCGKLL